MGSFPPAEGASVFSAIQVSRESLYASAMNRGLQYSRSGKHEQAIRSFRTAAAYSTDSTTPHLLLGRTYQIVGDAQRAIESYEKAVKLDPTSAEARNRLAFAYVTSERFQEAEREFKRLQVTNANDPGVAASLGHIYLKLERPLEAEAEFRKTVRLAPQDAASYYSLGLALNAQGRHAEAITQYQRAIEIRPGYASARADLAFASIDAGDTGTATLQMKLLGGMDTAEGRVLAEQVRLKLITPRIAYVVLNESSFNPLWGADAPLTWLDASLATPGASKVFTMKFQFNQAMDETSVENPMNWNIRKAVGGAGGVYANGYLMNVARQVGILPMPISVDYDPVTFEATVSFKITQNATGDGLIDPSHWVFRFLGTDAAGNPMDPDGDEWDGGALGAF